MNRSPLVSIIIPTLNRAHLIGETLNSILTQSYSNWECIVVDDGSTDTTDEVMEEYLRRDSRFRYFHRPSSHLSGGNGARNFGFKKCKGEYIQWFDSDDLLIADKLELQLLAFKEKNVDVIFSQSMFLNSKKRWSCDLDNYIEDISDALIKNHTKISVNSLLIKRKVLVTNNITWNESLKGGQEWDFNIRLFYTRGLKYYYLDAVLDTIRDNNYSITRDSNKTKRYNNYLLARIFILKFLISKDKLEFKKYFPFVFKDSLKFIKHLLEVNSYKNIFNFGKIIYSYSKRRTLLFFMGVIFLRFTGKSFLLNKIKD